MAGSVSLSQWVISAGTESSSTLIPILKPSNPSSAVMKMKNDYCSEITYFFAFLKNLPIELRLI
jgi:hypothetical protein